MKLALAYEQDGRFMAALDHLQTAEELGADREDLAAPMGRCLVRFGRLDEARPLLQLAAKKSPDTVSATVDLAQFWRAYGRPENALQVLREYIERHPRLKDAHPSQEIADLEAILLAADKAGGSEFIVEFGPTLQAAKPSDAMPNVLLGKHLLVLGRSKEASERLLAALKSESSDVDARFLLGLALARMPGYENQAILQWKEASRVDPLGGRIFVATADLFMKMGEFERAAIAYTGAAEMANESVGLYRSAANAWRKAGKGTEATYCDAREDAKLGDFTGALAGYRKLAGESSREWKLRGLGGIADIYRQMGKYREFLKAAVQAAVTGSAEDDLRVSDAYLLLNDQKSRMIYLKRALSKDPSIAGRFHREVAAKAERDGHWDLAEREYEKAAAANPQESSFALALSRIYFTRREKGNRIDRAINSARRAVELSPLDAKGYHQLAVCQTAAKQFDDAIASLQHAIDLDPERPASYLDLGQLLKRIGRTKRGDQQLQIYRSVYKSTMEGDLLTKQIKSNPNSPRAHIALGDHFSRIFRFDRAVSSYRHALELDSGNTEIVTKLAEAERASGAEVDRLLLSAQGRQLSRAQ